jgi:hypothetical protein
MNKNYYILINYKRRSAFGCHCIFISFIQQAHLRKYSCLIDRTVTVIIELIERILGKISMGFIGFLVLFVVSFYWG